MSIRNTTSQCHWVLEILSCLDSLERLKPRPSTRMDIGRSKTRFCPKSTPQANGVRCQKDKSFNKAQYSFCKPKHALRTPSGLNVRATRKTWSRPSRVRVCFVQDSCGNAGLMMAMACWTSGERSCFLTEVMPWTRVIRARDQKPLAGHRYAYDLTCSSGMNHVTGRRPGLQPPN